MMRLHNASHWNQSASEELNQMLSENFFINCVRSRFNHERANCNSHPQVSLFVIEPKTGSFSS